MRGPMSEWLFLTNHARVLMYISQYPSSTARRIAEAVGITERATQRLIRDLDEAGYISRRRVGRNNQYVVHSDREISGSVLGSIQLADLLACCTPAAPMRLRALGSAK